MRAMVSGDSCCWLCGWHEGRIPIYRTRLCWDYFRCPNCGVVSLRPIPDEEDLRIYYNEVYSVVLEGHPRETQRNGPPLLRELGERFPGRGRLLEVGCSYGFFLEAAQREGWETAGIELDDRAARYGREKLNLKIFCGTLESELPRLESPYDAVAAFHVVEHVRDPIGLLQCCRKLLRRGGALVLRTPNVASWIAKRTGAYWQWLYPPAHIHLFSPRTLELALEKSGFRVETIRSRRGDAYNNLFELVCALGRYWVLRKKKAVDRMGEKSLSDGYRRQMNAARKTSDVIYYPLGLVVDPWLQKKGLQPELVAIARV